MAGCGSCVAAGADQYEEKTEVGNPEGATKEDTPPEGTFWAMAAETASAVTAAVITL